MISDCITGIFGKLPAHGDFIQRNLPSDFVSVWDEWLQHYIAGSQEQIGENWLDIYLTSPIWRFMLSDGAADSSSWVGIMLPSVDKIGRYFPLSIVTQIPPHLSALEFLLSNNNWLINIEELAIQALDGDLTADDLIEEISKIAIIHNTTYMKQNALENSDPVVINMDFEEQAPTSVSDYLLDAILLKSVSSYSAWTTQGSEHVSPGLFLTRGLPPINGIAGMLNGQWRWQQPYQIVAM